VTVVRHFAADIRLLKHVAADKDITPAGMRYIFTVTALARVQ